MTWRISSEDVDAQLSEIKDNDEEECRSETSITKLRRQTRENWNRSSGWSRIETESSGIEGGKRHLLPVERKRPVFEILPSVDSTKQKRAVSPGISVCSRITRLMNNQNKKPKKGYHSHKRRESDDKSAAAIVKIVPQLGCVSQDSEALVSQRGKELQGNPMYRPTETENKKKGGREEVQKRFIAWIAGLAAGVRRKFGRWT